MNITIIIPAFNQEADLPDTLDSLEAASARVSSFYGAAVETIVVDNNSTDATTNTARNLGATVVRESVQGIARATSTLFSSWSPSFD